MANLYGLWKPKMTQRFFAYFLSLIDTCLLVLLSLAVADSGSKPGACTPKRADSFLLTCSFYKTLVVVHPHEAGTLMGNAGSATV